MGTSSQQAELIKKLGPRLQQEGFNTDIIAFDHNWDLSWYPMQVLQDAEARRYTAGTAWHCYGGNKWDPLGVRNAFPDKDIYFTECSGGEWDPSFDSGFGWNMENLFIAQSRVGARTVLLWNTAPGMSLEAAGTAGEFSPSPPQAPILLTRSIT